MPEKSERWLGLTAVLTRRREPMRRMEILERVAGYYGLSVAVGDDVSEARAQEAARRKFERDKEELRGLGIRLETVRIPGSSATEAQQGYRLVPITTQSFRIVISDKPEKHPTPRQLTLTWADVHTAERALHALAGRHHPMAAVARSVWGRLTAVPASDDPDKGVRVTLMPEEFLAFQVALVTAPRGRVLAERLNPS